MGAKGAAAGTGAGFGGWLRYGTYSPHTEDPGHSERLLPLKHQHQPSAAVAAVAAQTRTWPADHVLLKSPPRANFFTTTSILPRAFLDLYFPTSSKLISSSLKGLKFFDGNQDWV